VVFSVAFSSIMTIFRIMDITEPKLKIGDCISLSEASKMLGYKSFRNVNDLIKKGHLKAYRRKWSKYKMVSKVEVEKLQIVEEVNDCAKD
jgi:hypothetical protein